MVEIFKNNISVLLKHKSYIVTSFLMLVIALCAAVFISNKAEIQGNIAIVGIKDEGQSAKSKYLNIEILDKKPPKSSLVRGIYDAIITVNGADIEIDTLKDADFKEKIAMLVSNPNFVPKEDVTIRKVGSNILGYMLLFILFQALFYGKLILEEKEKHIIERIITTPIGFMKYLSGHMLFSFALIFIQIFFVISVAKAIGLDIGFSLLQYAGLITLITAVAVSMASFLGSLFAITDSYLMFGSAFITISTIATGSFSNFSKTETVFHKIINVFPQRNIIKFIDAVERGNISGSAKLNLIYILIIITGFFIFSIIKMKKDYVYKTS